MKSLTDQLNEAETASAIALAEVRDRMKGSPFAELFIDAITDAARQVRKDLATVVRGCDAPKRQPNTRTPCA